MTAQINDILIYKNKEYSMAAEPLEDYLKKIKLPYKFVAPSTACWRGYYSKWGIDNNKLFLIEWKGFILNYKEVCIEYLFPGDEIVFAYWFTGVIRIPLGKIIRYIHGGYASSHEGDMYLTFENGKLKGEEIKWLSEQEIEKIRNKSGDIYF